MTRADNAEFSGLSENCIVVFRRPLSGFFANCVSNFPDFSTCRYAAEIEAGGVNGWLKRVLMYVHRSSLLVAPLIVRARQKLPVFF